VLLFVLAPDFEQGQHLGGVAGGQFFGQPLQVGIHVVAVGQHFLHGGPRHEAPLVAGYPVAGGVVVGVEQVTELRVEGPVAGQVRGSG
jgi:hypothetical protein